MPEYPRSPFDKNGTSITPKVSGDTLDATIIGSTTPAAGNFTTGNFDADVSISGILKTPTTQTLTGAGAVDIVSAIIHLVTAGVGDAVTLADGTEGQMKTIIMKTITTTNDTAILTPVHFANATTITFNAADDVVVLLFTNAQWYIISSWYITLA